MTLQPNQHPAPDDLLAYATGGGDRASRSLLEAHVHLCRACSEALGRLAGPGGRLLRDLPVVSAPEGLLERILDRLPPQPGGGPDEVPLPPHLLGLLPEPSRRAWIGALGRGIRVLKVLEEAGAELFVLHLPPGAAFPHHAHSGRESALLLAGGALIEGRSFEAGDWAEFAPGSAHAPKADAEGCWLLVRVEGGVRLSGWRGWLQRIAGKKISF